MIAGELIVTREDESDCTAMHVGSSSNSDLVREPLISVITVCWNEAPERINQTFTSIYSQSYERVEHIVVDGGSSGESMAAIQAFADRINMLVSEPDRGIYDAMNKGIRLATGDLLIFMNVGDKFVDADTLTMISRFISSRPEFDYYYGDIFARDSGRLEFGHMPVSFGKFYMYDKTLCHQAIFARRSLFERVGGFDISYRLLADREWLLKVVKAGARGIHTGISICEFEIGGAAGDWRKTRNELLRLRKTHFGIAERLLFSLGWVALKIPDRMRTRNFSLPVGLQQLLNK